MESNDKLRETDIKIRTCYYFDDVIIIHDLDLDKILIDEKSYKNLLIYEVAYKTSYRAKPLHIISVKVD